MATETVRCPICHRRAPISQGRSRYRSTAASRRRAVGGAEERALLRAAGKAA